MDVLRDPRILPAPGLDAADPQGSDHLLDPLVLSPRGRGEPEDSSPGGTFRAVPLRDRDVDVLTNRVMGFVEDEEGDAREIVPSGREVVLHDLGGGEDEVGIGPTSLAHGPVDGPGKASDPKGDEPVPKGVRMLLDQRPGRCQHQDLSVLASEDLGGDQPGDDRLPEAGGKHHQEVLLETDPRQLDLEWQRADQAGSKKRMVDHPVGHPPDPGVGVGMGAYARHRLGCRRLAGNSELIEASLRTHGGATARVTSPLGASL